MAKKREFATDPATWRRFADKSIWRARPTTNLEALMELAPHETQRYESIESTAILKEVLGRAIDRLPEEDRWIIEALYIWELSLRVAGAALEIPKTSLARRRDRIRKQLIAELSESPRIQEWLRGGY